MLNRYIHEKHTVAEHHLAIDNKAKNPIRPTDAGGQRENATHVTVNQAVKELDKHMMEMTDPTILRKAQKSQKRRLALAPKAYVLTWTD